MLAGISLFSGAGGLDLGLAAAGIVTRLAVDADADCCSTLRANGNQVVLQTAVESLNGRDAIRMAGLDDGHLDVLSAGPPCQPFSKSANWANGQPAGMRDGRATSVVELVRLVKELQPRVLLMENVPGFVRHGGLAYLVDALNSVNTAIGTRYKLTYKVINAADFGVPQTRERLFLAGDRDGRDFKFPEPTHGSGRSMPWTTAWDAIGHLEDTIHDIDLSVRGRWAALLPSIPEGSNYLWHTDRGGGAPIFGWRTRYWSFLLKLAKAKPAWTIAASPSQNHGPFHWHNRRLSLGELKRLQTFPDSTILSGTDASRRRQLGNAVPPLLSEAIGFSLVNHLVGGQPTKPSSFAIATRNDLPPADPIRAVQDSYLALVGKHPSHPGHGLGPGALRRAVKSISLAD